MTDPQSFASPSLADALRAVADTIRVADFEAARAHAESAIARGLVHPAFHSARALWFERQGRDSDALASFQQARMLAPKDARLMNAIGLCFIRLWRMNDAVALFDEAIRIEPANSVTHQRRALALAFAGKAAESETAYRRAVQLDPHNAEALGSLAAIAARNGHAQPARQYAERALRTDADNGTARAALALVDLAAGDAQAAERHCLRVLENPQTVRHGKAVAFGLLGDALDAQDRTAEAFEAYTKSNGEHQKLHAPRFTGVASASDAIGAAITILEHAPPQLFDRLSRNQAAHDDAPRHVFLLGFHRSGTTLLGQALGSHPDIATLEEHDCLAGPSSRYLTSAEGIARLSALNGSELAETRADYWRQVRDHRIDPDRQIVVDKHPFHTIKLPLIHKLFPQARIVFALRDPRDVVLSCFRRHFDVDIVKFEFLSLENAARLYDLVMRVSALCRERLALTVFEHRHESLVADFDAQMQSVCAFLGVPWHQSMRNFAANAQGLDRRSLSAAQLQRGINGDGIGQWQRYRRELAPVLPRLEPWVGRFGYDPA